MAARTACPCLVHSVSTLLLVRMFPRRWWSLIFEVGCAGLREPFGRGEFDLLRVLEVQKCLKCLNGASWGSRPLVAKSLWGPSHLKESQGAVLEARPADWRVSWLAFQGNLIRTPAPQP